MIHHSDGRTGKCALETLISLAAGDVGQEISSHVTCLVASA